MLSRVIAKSGTDLQPRQEGDSLAKMPSIRSAWVKVFGGGVRQPGTTRNIEVFVHIDTRRPNLKTAGIIQSFDFSSPIFLTLLV